VNDLDARARAERLAAALGLTVRVVVQRRGPVALIERGGEPVDFVDAAVDGEGLWYAALLCLRGIGADNLPDNARGAAQRALWGQMERAGAKRTVAEAEGELTVARRRLALAEAEDVAAREALAATRATLADDRTRSRHR
jgi:hypothetical protein